MIRVVVIDDHPALRAGLQTVLDAEPGIVFAGESGGDEESVWPLLNRVEPDLILLDYHLPRGDGLQLCYRIKQQVPAPRVIIFSAYASPSLALPASLAQADGLLAKGRRRARPLHASARSYAGERLLPPISRRPCSRRRSSGLDPDDRALRRDAARRRDRDRRRPDPAASSAGTCATPSTGSCTRFGSTSPAPTPRGWIPFAG